MVIQTQWMFTCHLTRWRLDRQTEEVTNNTTLAHLAVKCNKNSSKGNPSGWRKSLYPLSNFATIDAYYLEKLWDLPNTCLAYLAFFKACVMRSRRMMTILFGATERWLEKNVCSLPTTLILKNNLPLPLSNHYRSLQSTLKYRKQDKMLVTEGHHLVFAWLLDLRTKCCTILQQSDDRKIWNFRSFWRALHPRGNMYVHGEASTILHPRNNDRKTVIRRQLPRRPTDGHLVTSIKSHDSGLAT